MAPTLLTKAPPQKVVVEPAAARDADGFAPVHALLKAGPDGELAVIDIAATVDTKGPQTAQMGPVKMTVSKFKVDTVGQNKVNIANSMLSSATLSQTGSMAMSVSAPGGAPGGESMVTNFKTTTVMVSREAPRPATSQPANK